jgi:hypothetical protein
MLNLVKLKNESVGNGYSYLISVRIEMMGRVIMKGLVRGMVDMIGQRRRRGMIDGLGEEWWVGRGILRVR